MNYATYTSEKSFTSVVSLTDGRAADSSARVVGMQVRFGLLLAVFLLRFSLISSAPFLAVLSSRTASNSSFNSSTKQRYMNVYQRYTLRSSTCDNLSKADLWSWFLTNPFLGQMIFHHLLPYTYYCKHVYITVIIYSLTVSWSISATKNSFSTSVLNATHFTTFDKSTASRLSHHSEHLTMPT